MLYALTPSEEGAAAFDRLMDAISGMELLANGMEDTDRAVELLKEAADALKDPDGSGDEMRLAIINILIVYLG